MVKLAFVRVTRRCSCNLVQAVCYQGSTTADAVFAVRGGVAQIADDEIRILAESVSNLRSRRSQFGGAPQGIGRR